MLRKFFFLQFLSTLDINMQKKTLNPFYKFFETKKIILSSKNWDFLK